MVLKKGLYPSFSFCSTKPLKIDHLKVFSCRDESFQLHGWAGSERQGQVEQGNSRWIDPWVNTCVCSFKIFVLKTAAAREQEKPNVVTSHGRIFQSYFFRNKLYLSLHASSSSPGVASAKQKLAVVIGSQIVAPVISCFKKTLFSADGGMVSRKHSC